MIKINFSGKYYKALTSLLKQQPEMEPLVDQTIAIFRKNPNDTRLRNHPLKRRMDGKWAFSITDDIRVIYEWTGKTTIRFLANGGHTIVYPRSI